MAYRPAQVYTGSTWDDIGDKRMLTHNHGGGANGANIPQSSVTDLTSDLAAKLDLAGGKILQIVRATDSTERETTSTSAVDVTGMSVTITPHKSDSAILVIATFSLQLFSSTTGTQQGSVRLTDSSNNALTGAQGPRAGLANVNFSGTSGWEAPGVIIGYSTPATTSATTYKMRFNVDAATTTIRCRNNFTTGQVFAIEVSA